jgi:A/G-specific adenine glycosylase
MPSKQPSTAVLRATRDALLAWYDAQRRDLPWRGTADPYAVLLSEVMLQQTQAARVMGRFQRFMARFPTAESLAAAAPADVLSEWSGLGYNRRALALQRAVRAICATGWPHEPAALERLPGVGPYTARALASLAFGREVGVVDTNVRRWLTRRYGARSAVQLQHLADRLASGARRPEDVAAWTHASMEFGATVCASRRPRCAACPLARACPSRGRPPSIARRRQPTFAGSDRALRGALVRCLARARGHRLRLDAAIAAVADIIAINASSPQLERVLAALERDGLTQRHGPDLVLGTSTIER